MLGRAEFERFSWCDSRVLILIQFRFFRNSFHSAKSEKYFSGFSKKEKQIETHLEGMLLVPCKALLANGLVHESLNPFRKKLIKFVCLKGESFWAKEITSSNIHSSVATFTFTNSVPLKETGKKIPPSYLSQLFQAFLRCSEGESFLFRDFSAENSRMVGQTFDQIWNQKPKSFPLSGLTSLSPFNQIEKVSLCARILVFFRKHHLQVLNEEKFLSNMMN